MYFITKKKKKKTCQGIVVILPAMAKAGLQQKAAPTTIPAVCMEHADDASTRVM